MAQTPISQSQLSSEVPVIQSRYKTTNETISTDTTFSDDNALTGFILEPNGVYSMVGGIIISFANVLMGTKMRFNPSVGDIAASGYNMSGLLYFSGDSNDSPVAMETRVTTSDTVGLEFVGHNSTLCHLVFNGSIVADTAGAVVDLQWAQKVSNGSNLQYRVGSWATFTRIG